MQKIRLPLGLHIAAGLVASSAKLKNQKYHLQIKRTQVAKENALHVFYLDYKLVMQVLKSNIGSRLTIKLKIRTDSKLLSGFAAKKLFCV